MTIPSAVEWKGGWDGELSLLDQTLLPEREERLTCSKVEEVWESIRRLAVRGAPAIGVAAAYGALIGARKLKDLSPSEWEGEYSKILEYLSSSRPTAVNLFWALNRQEEVFSKNQHKNFEELLEALLESAKAIHREDERMCRSIGEHGQALIPQKCRVLTHCNAGSLATGGMGTALSLLYIAKELGKEIEAFTDETRPLLQGSRLSAFELQRSGIPTTVICDNMAASLMREGLVDLVVVGADRIARNGDGANKIGTYGLALVAHHHGIPFYMAAPSSTFDLSLERGDQIPIEHREGEEVFSFAGQRTAPKGVQAYNPAFDVTPAHLITAIITEKGIIQPVNREEVERVLRK